jgi:hypothetical protein
VAWHWLSAFAPPLDVYTHYAFDLDALLAAHQIAADDSVYFKFEHYAENADDGLAIDSIRVGQGDVLGPKILSISDISYVGGVASMVVTFSRPMDETTFTASDVTILPGQQNFGLDTPVAVLSVDPDVGDGSRFRVAFAAPVIGGSYSLTIDADISDLDGVPVNRNRDDVANGSGDDYTMSFPVEPVAQSLPYRQDFEGGDVAALAGWTLRVMGDFEYGMHTWNIVDPTGANGMSSRYLEADQGWDCWTDHEAILKLDLRGLIAADAQRLELSFGLMFQERTALKSLPDRRSVTVFVRGDPGGETDPASWLDITESFGYGATLVPPLEGEYFPYRLRNLGAALEASGIALDGDVYIKFNRRGFHKYAPIAIDNIVVQVEPPSPSPAAAAAVVRRADRAQAAATTDDGPLAAIRPRAVGIGPNDAGRARRSQASVLEQSRQNLRATHRRVVWPAANTAARDAVLSAWPTE